MTLLVIAASIVAACAAPAFAQDPVKADRKQYTWNRSTTPASGSCVRPRGARREERPARPSRPRGRDPRRHVGALHRPRRQVPVSRPEGRRGHLHRRRQARSREIGKGKLEAIIVELKGNAAPTAGPAAPRPGLTSTPLIDNPRVRVSKVTADPTFAEPAGTTHDYDQVVIPLGTGAVALTVDGKTTTSWKLLGDATFIGRGSPHESKNTGGKSFDFVVVGIK